MAYQDAFARQAGITLTDTAPAQTDISAPAKTYTQAELDKATADAAAKAQAQAAIDSQANSNSVTTTTAATNAINNQNALAMLQSTLAGYGIDPTGVISNAILGLQQSNYDAATIQALIQDPTAANSKDPNVVALSNAWNTRFAGNVAREKAGLPPLDTATYLATEQQYKQVMQRAGLPAAAIDNAYIGNLMAVDVSPAEVQQRIDAATTAVTAEDPYVKQQLNQMGLGTGDMVLHLLDPSLASNVIQQKVTAAQIGAEAQRQGLGTSQDYAMQLAAQGVTQGQAAQGFTSIAQQQLATQSLASRYAGYGDAGSVGQSLQNATFGTNAGGETPAQAEQRLKRLQTQEASSFGGSAGVSTQGQSLGIGNAQGVS